MRDTACDAMANEKCQMTYEKLWKMIRVSNKSGHRRDGRSGNVVAHTGLEPVISALRGQRVNQLHQCAANGVEL